MVTPGKDVDSDRALLARALGGLLAMRRFDTPMQVAKAIHTGTLALRMFSSALGEAELARLKQINQSCLEYVGITEADRQWLMATMRSVLGRAGEGQPAEERIH